LNSNAALSSQVLQKSKRAETIVSDAFDPLGLDYSQYCHYGQSKSGGGVGEAAAVSGLLSSNIIVAADKAMYPVFLIASLRFIVCLSGVYSS